MTDRQKFVYDLALQHVSAELANGVPLDKNPAAYLSSKFKLAFVRAHLDVDIDFFLFCCQGW